MWVYGGAPVRYGLSGTSSLCYLLGCVSVALDDIYFGAGLECAPGSVQPVIHMKDGERQMGERWGFKLPDRLLFNARSDNLAVTTGQALSMQTRRSKWELLDQ
jgi:hypothetical protein